MQRKYQVVIVPIYKSPEDLAKISEAVNPIFEQLKAAGAQGILVIPIEKMII